MKFGKHLAVILVFSLALGIFGFVTGDDVSLAKSKKYVKAYKIKVVDVNQNDIYFKFTSKKKPSAKKVRAVFQYQKTGKKESWWGADAKKQTKGEHKGTYKFTVKRYGLDFKLYAVYGSKKSNTVKSYSMPAAITSGVECIIDNNVYNVTWGSAKGATQYLVEYICMGHNLETDGSFSAVGLSYTELVKDTKFSIDMNGITQMDYIDKIIVTPLGPHGESTRYTQTSEIWENPNASDWDIVVA